MENPYYFRKKYEPIFSWISVADAATELRELQGVVSLAAGVDVNLSGSLVNTWFRRG